MEEGAYNWDPQPWTTFACCPNSSLKPKPKPELNKKVTHCGDLRGTSTLPKVFDQPNGSKLELVWKGRQPVGPQKHPSLFSKSLGVLMVTSRRFDWTKNWELQDVGDKEWLWDNIKDKWELDETWKEPTLGLIFGDEFKNKKSKWKMNFYSRYATYEERISHRPEQLSQREWVQLVEFWDTPEHQSQEVVAPHFLGDLFVRTHTSSQTHDVVGDQSREYTACNSLILDKMKDLAGIDEHGTQLPLSDEIYREVMPPEWHGRVRLNGRGVTPTNYFGSTGFLEVFFFSSSSHLPSEGCSTGFLDGKALWLSSCLIRKVKLCGVAVTNKGDSGRRVEKMVLGSIFTFRPDPDPDPDPL
ncbi:hypothetical protein IFM89_026099 [Coptis chinensis]|uniref:Uncharacterized protein n=1 Tax=Coptis chinensis TaxID=261450 RepID=A0A835LJU2_9MAGN|nr:hypothetical protein IFM89_026099 [Coptis chinensis]